MHDPCRVCGGCLQGSRCRWLFSACGRLRLAVVLSHVLELELHRDGRSEFLCGKCVFSLERVVHCDVAIGQLREAHAAQLQRLQNERDGLKMHIANKYKQHNLPNLDGSVLRKSFRKEVKTGTNTELRYIHRSSVQTKQRQLVNKDICDSPGKSQGVDTSADDGQEKFKGRLRRCVSLEPLSREVTDRSQRLQLNLSTRQSKDVHSGLPGTLSQEYLSIVHRRSTLMSQSTSLQSVTLDRSDHAPINASHRRNPLKTSLVVDILQLLRIVQVVRPIPRCKGSKIPVLTPSHFTHGHAHGGMTWKWLVEKRLREMEDDFNDEYTPLKPEVHTLAVRFGSLSGAFRWHV
nr:uncharacterized protein LOC129423041 [Misgurnus anguillicaudatus]